MKDKKKQDDLSVEEWLENLLNSDLPPDEISADHHAMDAVGLKPAGSAPGSIPSAAESPASPPVPAFHAAGSLEPPEPFHDAEFRDTFGEGADLAQIIDEVSRESAVVSDRNTQKTARVTAQPTTAVSVPVPVPAPTAVTPSEAATPPVEAAPAKDAPEPPRERNQDVPPVAVVPAVAAGAVNAAADVPTENPPVAPAEPTAAAPSDDNVPAPAVESIPPVDTASSTMPVEPVAVVGAPAVPAVADAVTVDAPPSPRKAATPPLEKSQRRKQSKASKKAAEEELAHKKGRPGRKKGYGLLGLPHMVVTVIWLCIILVIGVTLGRMIWMCATDVLAFGRDPITATVVIEESDTIEDISAKLEDAGLIRYGDLFKFYADLTDAKESIQPGTYAFNGGEEGAELVVYDYMALVSVMSPSSGLTVVEDLRIPEGFTCAQIFQLLEENNVCTVAELEEYCVSGELSDYWFLEGVERDNRYCLEGYLFPNTYDFYENDDPKRVLEKMLNAFDANFTDQMRDDLNMLNEQLAERMRKNGYDEAYIDAHRITIREATIIASMIEKETANNVESFTISSVIYNRLTNAGKYPYLNIDATLVYALDGKADLTEEDKKLDSPYNTYLYKGLPPGPISNPSQNSLAAALLPDETDFHYYAYNPSAQEHKFSNTYEEHLEFLAALESGQIQEAEEDE